MKLRISKYLSSCGLGARRKCEEMVEDGKVCVNGNVVNDLAFKVDDTRDEVLLEGKKITPQEKVYYALNKPIGYTTTLSDPYAQKTIIELVPNKPSVWPVGRLDKNTSGLIIITNDGELTQNLTHPKFEKEKEYVISLDRPLKELDFKKIREGVLLEDGLVKPDFFIEKGKKYTIVIHEGRKRIIRRLFKSLGYTVTELTRVRISNLKLNNLKPGCFRKLSDNEVKDLQNA